MTELRDYFAYGSNNDEQMHERIGRVPSKAVGFAQLREHRPAFMGRSVKRYCGTLTALHTGDPTDVVLGTLYLDLTQDEFAIIDRKEGAAKKDEAGKPAGRYMRITRTVLINEGTSDPRQAELYVMTGNLQVDREERAPSTNYLFNVLEAAFRMGFPRDYIERYLIVPTENVVRHEHMPIDDWQPA